MVGNGRKDRPGISRCYFVVGVDRVAYMFFGVIFLFYTASIFFLFFFAFPILRFPGIAMDGTEME